MADLQNEFSWSKSRHEKFKECRRAYYYTYYGSWGGWEAQHGSAVRELYVLKKLSTRWQWAGSVVHEAIRQLLERAKLRGELTPVDALVQRTRERARAQWAGSRDKSYWREASKIVGLVEHEYGEPVANDEWKRLYDQVIEGSLRAFYASPTLEVIRRTPRDAWLTIDRLDSWDFEGSKIWMAIDFAYRDGDGRVHVLDWKTGKERGVDHLQVGTYALYARNKWGVGPDGVVGGLVYLVGSGEGAGAGERVEVSVDEATLSSCEQEMRASIGAMRAALQDPARNVAGIEAFPQMEERERCKRCPYRRPCGRT
ncbi:MAG TPA: PD-(D/E)XK nuclease family protein [Anaeromyxobacteraceae bacterium]|nr:PD-(D/E)XK nuclease family protein [Anaeromyxobacteraceae bacterium]